MQWQDVGPLIGPVFLCPWARLVACARFSPTVEGDARCRESGTTRRQAGTESADAVRAVIGRCAVDKSQPRNIQLSGLPGSCCQPAPRLPYSTVGHLPSKGRPWHDRSPLRPAIPSRKLCDCTLCRCRDPGGWETKVPLLLPTMPLILTRQRLHHTTRPLLRGARSLSRLCAAGNQTAAMDVPVGKNAGLHAQVLVVRIWPHVGGEVA